MVLDARVILNRKPGARLIKRLKHISADNRRPFYWAPIAKCFWTPASKTFVGQCPFFHNFGCRALNKIGCILSCT